jgi:hypothetical protein
MPSVRDTAEAGSLTTEEKTKQIAVVTSRGKPPSMTRDDRPTSAPTGNWFETDRTNAGQRSNSAP